MSVRTQHTSYIKYAPQWRKMRDLVSGRDEILRQARLTALQSTNAVKSVDYFVESYIPKLSGQTPNEYLAYAERAEYYNATGRTIDALAGMIFAKSPTKQIDPAIESYLDDITLSGLNMREFVNQVVYEELTTSRVGLLVDYPSAPTNGLTVADAERLNLRPFITKYKAESIMNIRETVVNGARVLTQVVLTESVDDAENEFETKTETNYRVLDLFEGIYRIRVFNENDEVITESFPRMNGAQMSYIPFYIVGGTEWRKPLLLDLADVNVAHLRNSADYENGLHIVGVPTPYITGVTDDSVTMNIGSNSAWLIPDPSSKVGFLEFMGQGLTTLSDAMKAKEQRMATLGARMLAEEKRTAEASSTLEQKTSGEKSILASVAYDVSDAVTKALNTMSQWVNSTQTNMYELNTDYTAMSMDAQMFNSYMQSVQGGLMPMRDFFDALKRGDLISQAREFEAYQEDLQSEQPSIITESQPNSGLLSTIRSRMGL